MSTVEDDEQELTRKQRRDQARAQRREMEQAALDAAKRRTRLIQLGIALLRGYTVPPYNYVRHRAVTQESFDESLAVASEE